MPSPPPEAELDPREDLFGQQDRSWLHRAIIVLAPAALAVDIFLSLWVGYLHVKSSAVIQVEPEWVAGESLAVRAQLLDAGRSGVRGTQATLAVRRDAEILAELEPLPAVGSDGVAQGAFDVPGLPPGPAELVVTLRGGDLEVAEAVPIEIVAEREKRRGDPTISTSMLQWADDTDEQPEDLRIDLRPFGRILAGFDNTFTVRVTEVDGTPHEGEIEIALASGEFGGSVGSEQDPPLLYSGPVDSLGLAEVSGILTSEVVRLEVRVLPPEPAEPVGDPPVGDPPVGDPPEGDPPPAESPDANEPEARVRRFRLVTFPGAVRMHANPLAVRPGEKVRLSPQALRPRRPIFVDVHSPTGAWMQTVMPPFVGHEQPRPFAIPATTPEGFVQFEAYHYTNKPGEGTAVATVYVANTDPSSRESLTPLVEEHRRRAANPQIDKEFERKRELAYLDLIAATSLSPAEVAQARRWLIGSLPLEVYGPPTALSTRQREEDQLAAKKERWTLGLRWFLWGGGGVFMAFMVFLVWRDAKTVAVATRAALATDDASDADGTDAMDGTDGEGEALLAKRALLARGALVLFICAAGLVLTAVMLESLVWNPG